MPYREAPDLPVIALMKDALTLSLEPGGQIRAVRKPLLHGARGACGERGPLRLRDAAESLRLYPVALGYRPFDEIDEMPWMPQDPLPGDARVAPPPRWPGEGHDVDDLHGPGLARLGERGGLRPQGRRLRAADPHPRRALCEQPARQRQAERLPVVSEPRVDRCRFHAVRLPAVHVRQLLFLQRLRGVGAGRAAAFPPPRRRVPAPGADLPASCCRTATTGIRRPSATGRITSPRCSPRSGSRRSWRFAAPTA